LLLSLVCNIAFSQTENFECATDDVSSSDPAGEYSYATTSENPNLVVPFNVPLVLNVYYWQVNNSNGEYNPNNDPSLELNETKVLESVAFLNKHYNEFNIYFKYFGFEVIPQTPADLPNKVWEETSPGSGSYHCATYPGFDPDGYGNISRCQISAFFNWAEANYYNPNALNIYVPYQSSGYGGAADTHLSTRSIVKVQNILHTTLIHEVGHNLNIRHTRSSNENVTRDPEDTNFNAATAGDQVVDTNAQRPFRKGSEINGSLYHYVNLNICEYAPTGNDPNNQLPLERDSALQPYAIEQYDIKNVMSDCYPCQDEDSKLTMGQGIRARETIYNNSDVGDEFEGAITTVASLYEPYKGEYYIAGPTPSPPNPPLFQPGFKYRFFECECDCPNGEPTPYEDVSFNFNHNVLLSIEKDETDFTSITHPNHSAVHIVFDHPFPDSYGQWTRKCYDNWNRAPIGGSVTKFNDNVFNTNVTITPKDSTEINNPNLINLLDPGLYKIEKEHEDGAVQQTIIVKDNN